MKKILIIWMLLFPLMAAAADKTTLNPTLCQALTKHTPSPDVAYQAGVDVHGNAVAPADLPGSPTSIQMPGKIVIPLTLQLTKLLHVNTNQYPYNTLGAGTEAGLGNLTVEGDQVLFNDQPLSDDQQSNLAILCMKQGSK